MRGLAGRGCSMLPCRGEPPVWIHHCESWLRAQSPEDRILAVSAGISHQELSQPVGLRAADHQEDKENRACEDSGPEWSGQPRLWFPLSSQEDPCLMSTGPGVLGPAQQGQNQGQTTCRLGEASKESVDVCIRLLSASRGCSRPCQYSWLRLQTQGWLEKPSQGGTGSQGPGCSQICDPG